ncbi:hypothetical protein [Streptomyces griseorubiginosus]|uniref:Uncharacterized protein n=1 Tax=Streptomyces griseorubiginosus TaxID=67304 RepID=A0AAI8PNG2_9ACTN|nr:hypothetical protein [Streptomyces griseorubiginosus]AYC39229.1 hypothetical protein DWG14_03462 [Streptomyces griseorubiginosus]
MHCPCGVRQTAFAVLAATPLLDGPVVTNGESMPCGSGILSHLVNGLLGFDDNDDLAEPRPELGLEGEPLAEQVDQPSS